VQAVLKRPTSCLIDACKRFGIHQPPSVTTDEQIVSICQCAKGMSSKEIAQFLGKSINRINVLARTLADAGKLHKAGSLKAPRYFVEAEHAQQHEEAFKLECIEKETQRRKRKQAAKTEARRLERLANPQPAPVPKKVKAEPAPVVRSTKQAEPVAKPSKVIWPESVKVQAIPTPPSRFAFEPPPGWRGQITHDWMDRRLQGAGA
jgi:transposase